MRFAVTPVLCWHRRSLLLACQQSQQSRGLGLFGPDKFRRVVSCPFPCRHRPHTTPRPVFCPRSSFCGDLYRVRCGCMCCSSRRCPAPFGWFCGVCQCLPIAWYWCLWVPLHLGFHRGGGCVLGRMWLACGPASWWGAMAASPAPFAVVDRVGPCGTFGRIDYRLYCQHRSWLKYD